MAKEKNEEYKDMSVDEMVKKLTEKRNEILNEFAKAYLAETGLLPSQVELITQELHNDSKKIEHRYFFRRKNDGN